MNVLAKIGYDNSTVEIEFPIDDDELDRTLKQNYMPTDTTKPFLVRNIDYPTILSELTGRTVSYVDHYTTKDGVRHETPRRFRYICAGKAMKRNECEGQSAYVAERVDCQVIDFLRECFKRIKLTPRDAALEAKFKADLSAIKKQIKTLEKDTETQKRKLGELTEEIANALIGDSKFTPDVLAIAIDRSKQKIADNKSEIQSLEKKLSNQESEMFHMKAIDVKCPICEYLNKSLDLVETDGWMECEHCGSTVQILKYVRSHRIPICQMKDAKLLVPLSKR